MFILIAYLDWTDDDTWLDLILFFFYQCLVITYNVEILTLTRWFMLATVTSHWIFKEDYPNKVVSTICI